MNEEQCNLFYQHLLSTLRQSSLFWIIEQVNETIALGKPQTKKVKPFREQSQRTLDYYTPSNQFILIDTSEYQLPVGAETNLTSTTDYTSAERLLLLIDAIERALVDTASMAASAINSLENLGSSQQLKSIRFEAEQEDQETLRISQKDSRQQARSTSQLRQLLNQLREKIRDNQ